MTVSVAMCTYNGAKYIREQLDSIIHQTRPVDEIIISDDGSSDDTINILRTYAEKYPCIHYSKNSKNKGFKQNFMDTMRQCSGDIVFLSDQDDCWHPNKVEYILDWYNMHPKMQLVFTNANIIDGVGKPTGETAFDLIGFDLEKQKAALHGYMMDILCVNNRATGATMAIRKEFIQFYKDDWYADEKFHDTALTLEAAGQEVLGFISEPLIDYRIHSNNATGIDKVNRLFWEPYIPMMITYNGEARWTPTAQRLVAFSRRRVSFKYSLFGVKATMCIPQYVKMYGSLWYKAYYYDMNEAWKHTRERITNYQKKK